MPKKSKTNNQSVTKDDLKNFATKDDIKSVRVTEQHETAGIADPALKGMPEAVLKAQSADVDTISGCTDSCKGVLSAVKDALSKAGAVGVPEAKVA